jgi:hypothetical protein
MIDDPRLAWALDTVIARNRHARYRDLCDPDHPDHNPAYVPIVLAMAERPAPTPSRPGVTIARRSTGPPPAVAVHYHDPDAPRPCGYCPGAIPAADVPARPSGDVSVRHRP